MHNNNHIQNTKQNDPLIHNKNAKQSHKTLLVEKLELNIKNGGTNKSILNDITFSVEPKDVIVILGSSGSGKSSILKCINFLTYPSAGKIVFNNQVIIDHNNHQYPKETTLNTYRQKVGKVFQHFNLFPHLTILENLCLAPKSNTMVDHTALEKKALSLLASVDLEGFASRNVWQLSGGQKQRIAIIRALMMDPKLMLFDEPTSALDPENKHAVLKLITSLKEKMPLILVTHEIEFAKKAATKILFINNGKIIEQDTPDNFFNHPKTKEVQQFLEKLYN